MNQMPPMSTNRVDARGAELLSEWIKQLETKSDLALNQFTALKRADWRLTVLVGFLEISLMRSLPTSRRVQIEKGTDCSSTCAVPFSNAFLLGSENSLSLSWMLCEETVCPLLGRPQTGRAPSVLRSFLRSGIRFCLGLYTRLEPSDAWSPAQGPSGLQRRDSRGSRSSYSARIRFGPTRCSV